MNMHQNECRPHLGLRESTCLLLQCGMVPLYLAVAAVYIEAGTAPLHAASAARYREMLLTVMASLVLLTFGALVAELAAREQAGKR